MKEFRSLLRTKGTVPVLLLRRLLHDIMEQRPDVCFRYRLLGEMWTQNFKRILHVSDRGVLLRDEVTRHLTAINDLGTIMQFEIDNPFQEFQPYFHYLVTLEPAKG